MKSKLFIALAVILAAAVAVWSWRHRSPSIAKVPAAGHATKIASGPSVHPSHSISLNRGKMLTVAIEPRPKRSSLSPAREGWSDLEIIVDDNAGYEARLEAIGRLPRTLTRADWQALKKFLLKSDSQDEGQLNQVVKNNLMDALCAMDPPPDGLGNVLAQIYQNLLQNEVVRDYSLQHLATLDVDLLQGGQGGQSVAREEQTDQKVLWSALNETGDSIAGTALLGLVRLSQQPNATVDQGELGAAALQLAGNSNAGELAQITAYQVCAQLNIQTALPTIEAAAQNSPTVAAQISAIGALGLLGGSADIPLLQKLLQGNNERLQLPVQTAIERIQARTQGMSQSS